MSKDNGIKIVIITVAGISARFNEGIEESQKMLKAIYTDRDGNHQTLLSHLVKQCEFSDKIIIVGGYKYDDLKRYIETAFSVELKEKITLVRNNHYEDLASGYSLFLGLKTAFEEKNIRNILFVEGDLDIDDDSFKAVIKSEKTVLTDTYEPINASKSVVFYKDTFGKYKYAFNSQHGLLRIEEPFSIILNSGQLWKFTDAEMLKKAAADFIKTDKGGTNLSIIQKYLDGISPDDIEIIKLQKWTNCNTRDDYRKIRNRWEETK